MKASKPIFAQLEELVKKQNLKKQEKLEAGVDLPDLNKVITKIKATIEKIKEKETVFIEDKTQFTNKINHLKNDRIFKLGQIRTLRAEKNILKEDFYSRMIEYEL